MIKYDFKIVIKGKEIGIQITNSPLTLHHISIHRRRNCKKAFSIFRRIVSRKIR
jgi:hypothetical protein